MTKPFEIDAGLTARHSPRHGFDGLVGDGTPAGPYLPLRIAFLFDAYCRFEAGYPLIQSLPRGVVLVILKQFSKKLSVPFAGGCVFLEKEIGLSVKGQINL